MRGARAAIAEVHWHPVEPGEVIANRYEIERLCGTGGMAVVYRARDMQADVPVALKVLRTGSRGADLKRFLLEGETLASLSHPGIVRSIDRGTTPIGEAYIVQEWVDGVTLRERIRSAPLTMRDAVAIAIQVADALGEAHGKGIVHRDVKPGNVMLEGGDPARVKVLDFGIARVEAGPVSRLTRTGAIVGTVNYMAPEQARAARDIDPSADIFALGAVLYECLTGREAFGGKSALATRAKIIALAPAPIPVPPALAALLERMLSKLPSERPADGAAAAVALRALGDVPATPLPGDPRPVDAQADGSDFTCVVMSAPATALLGKPPEELRVEVNEVAGAFGCAGVVMEDGAALILSPTEGSSAERAATTTRAALALKRRWDVIPIAVAGGVDSSGLERSIDNGASTLETLALQAVFAELTQDGPPAGVLVEPEVAALIENEFEIQGDPQALRVVAERR